MIFFDAEGTDTILRLLTSLLHLLAATTSARPATVMPPAPLPRASEPRAWVVSILVSAADFFNTPLTALGGRFLSDTMLVKAGTKDETEFLPNSWPSAKYTFSSRAWPFAYQTNPWRQSQAAVPVCEK